MKCHYEVLDVPRDADDAEIKSAYRKLALKWHPDKNLDNIDYAKEHFQLVQQAYEVLSDKHERAWYDTHREQILHGANSQFQDNSLDVFQYFGSCFKGYGDDENGFYTVYRTVFEEIAKEDIEHIENKEEFSEIPSFGNSQTDYEKVAEFYAYWSNYFTKKSYVWLDPYDIRDIRERRYLKLVEKENKKVRQQAKKERNEEIRNLVAFVRKRDKRVQAQKKVLEEKQLINKKKREQVSRQKKLQRQQELNDSNVEPEWAKFDNFKTELEELEKKLAEEFGDSLSDSDIDMEEDIHTLYCVACNKMFKTPKSFENHESSKKHKENVENLKVTLLDEENSHKNVDENDDSSPDEEIEVEYSNATIYNENYTTDNKSDADEDVEAEHDSAMEESLIRSKKKKKQKNVISLNEYEHLGNSLVDIANDLDNDFSPNKKQKKSRRKIKNEKVSNADINTLEEKQEQNDYIEENKSRKTKRDKKNKKDDIKKANDIDICHNCLTCKSVFSSKNKLFDHLKKTGHGVYIDPNSKTKTKQIVKN